MPMIPITIIIMGCFSKNVILLSFINGSNCDASYYLKRNRRFRQALYDQLKNMMGKQPYYRNGMTVKSKRGGTRQPVYAATAPRHFIIADLIFSY